MTLAVCLMSVITMGNAGQFNTDSVVLYQPDAILQPRISGARSLADYIKRLQAVCGSVFADAVRQEILDIVVAVKPGRRSRVWVITSRPDANADPELAALKVRLEEIEPVEVREGPIAFAILASIRGARRPDVSDAAFQPPLPKEWQQAASRLPKSAIVPDDILRIVWP